MTSSARVCVYTSTLYRMPDKHIYAYILLEGVYGTYSRVIGIMYTISNIY